MPESFVFLCVRVYANGEARETVRDLKGVVGWLEFNRVSRPGCALFVNAELTHPDDGKSLGVRRCRQVQAMLLPEYMTRHKGLVPVAEDGLQVEIIAGHPREYIGYPPETVRKKIRFKR